MLVITEPGICFLLEQMPTCPTWRNGTKWSSSRQVRTLSGRAGAWQEEARGAANLWEETPHRAKCLLHPRSVAEGSLCMALCSGCQG